MRFPLWVRIRPRRFKCTLFTLAFLICTTFAPRAIAQSVQTDSLDLRTPRGALWRAAVIPGWGQFYNRQYIKLPFVYGAIGGLIVAGIRNNKDYQLYRKAFLYKAYEEQVESGIIETNPREDDRDSYEELAAEFGPISSFPLRLKRDNLRRNRDLSYLGAGIIYALSILDAFVSAHLLDFDVDENLSIRISPIPDGIRLSARIAIP